MLFSSWSVLFRGQVVLLVCSTSDEQSESEPKQTKGVNVFSSTGPVTASPPGCDSPLSGILELLDDLASFSCRQNLLADCLQGCFVVACTLCAFISLVWLREQIVHGGAPQWLDQNPPPLVPNGPAPANQVRALLAAPTALI